MRPHCIIPTSLQFISKMKWTKKTKYTWMNEYDLENLQTQTSKELMKQSEL